MLIRDATTADWPAIYPIFRRIVDEGRTYAYPEGLASDEACDYWMGRPPARTVVAVEQDAAGGAGEAVLGTATMGPNRPGRGSHVATASFMVHPEVHNRGVGRALATETIEWAEAGGYHSVQFNAVVETNSSAIHLWRSLGFQILTTVPEAFDHAEYGLVGLHLMYLRLSGSTAHHDGTTPLALP